MFNDTRLTELLGTELPIIQAPMAGAQGSAMAAAAAEAGGLGSLPCAMLDTARMRAEMGVIRQRTQKPVNMNFFCHTPAAPAPEAQRRWRTVLKPYYEEHGLDADADTPAPNRAPFDTVACEIVEELRPQVVSFHFGLPEKALLDRVRATGAKIISSATTAAEARWLAERGCDAIIAQGAEAGGHRGVFLDIDISRQPGTFALVPQVVDAVDVPVIAAGGITDARGIAAAFMLGAAGVQIGTAFLFTPEATISDLHRAALDEAADDGTALTNIFSGRPARGLMNRVMREHGPMSPDAPPFPTAGGALVPLKAAAEKQGKADFSSLWAGQAAALGRKMETGELMRMLADQAAALLKA
ncbi:MAG: NAD(P)H-dependent flavin oxidoreductase [Minwuia sp.]|uniref:NAD(P)H-dependent flavin oxidoreductase n=1 Tax=Minwuia sp. TaxID=2493630 RepID=UPI003A84FCDC